MMSPDLRNSIHLWVGAVLVGCAFWIVSKYDLFHGISETWVGGLTSTFGFIGLIIFVRGLWQRRASNPNHPNGG